MRDLKCLTKEEGQQIAYFALLLPIMLAMLGLAIDIGYTYSRVRQSQNIADAASAAAAQALGASGHTCADQTGLSLATSVALDYAVRNGIDNDPQRIVIQCPPQDPSDTAHYGKPNFVYVKITQQVQTFFAGVIGINTLPARADAIAGFVNTPLDASLIVLDRSSEETGLNLDPSAVLTINQGSFYVNAAGSNAVGLANKYIESDTPGVIVGGYQGSVTDFRDLNGNTQKPRTYLDPPLDDPMANVPAPTVSGRSDFCSDGAQNFKNENVTLPPGRYCGGISIKNGTLTLRDGVYIIQGGDIIIDPGSAWMVADQVMLYFDSGTLNNGNLKGVSLTPINDSTPGVSASDKSNYGGISLFRRGSRNTLTLNPGSSGNSIHGVFYMPNTDVVMDPSSTAQIESLICYTLYIKKQLVVTGYRGYGWPTTIDDGVVQ